MKKPLMSVPSRPGVPPTPKQAVEGSVPALFRSEAFAEDLTEAAEPPPSLQVWHSASEAASRVPLLGLAMTTLLGWFGR